MLALGRCFNTSDDFKPIDRQSMTRYDGLVGIPRFLVPPAVTCFPKKRGIIFFSTAWVIYMGDPIVLVCDDVSGIASLLCVSLFIFSTLW